MLQDILNILKNSKCFMWADTWMFRETSLCEIIMYFLGTVHFFLAQMKFMISVQKI